MQFAEQLSPADAAVLETFVVPRYLSLFGQLVLDLLLVGSGAQILHLGCRTGYPNLEIVERFGEGVRVVGVDGSTAALEIAQVKAAESQRSVDYYLAPRLPLEVVGETYSHVMCLHPVGADAERQVLFEEAYRMLYPGGQVLVALPLRGSFQELGDLLREYALKHDEDEFGDRVETMMARRPTIETLAGQLEGIGFTDVDVEIRSTELVFDSGRAFVDDPITRLLVVPDLMSELAVEDMDAPMAYLRDAIDRYWSEHQFGLSLNVGCASARRA